MDTSSNFYHYSNLITLFLASIFQVSFLRFNILFYYSFSGLFRVETATGQQNVVSEIPEKPFSLYVFIELLQSARVWLTSLLKVFIDCKIRTIFATHFCVVSSLIQCPSHFPGSTVTFIFYSALELEDVSRMCEKQILNGLLSAKNVLVFMQLPQFYYVPTAPPPAFL